MKELTKQDLQDREALCQRLQTAHAALESAVEAYNDLLTRHWGNVDEASTAYQHIVDEVKGWCETIAEQIQEEIDGHQEKWQDSERGQVFVSWQQEYEQVNFEGLELDKPEPLSLDVSDQSEVLDGLPDSP